MISCSDFSDNSIPPQPTHPKEVDIEPDWSPNGEMIAYTHVARHDSEYVDGLYQIWLLDLTNGTKEFITPGFLPDWSPDGNQIVFVLGSDIHVFDVNTKMTTRLTTWGSCYYPSWSPDGRRIVFDTNHLDPTGANVIWLMNSDGGDKRDISQHGVGEWRQPQWTNTSQILHVRYVATGFPEVFLMDTLGANSIQLTSNNHENHDPSWSLNSQKIGWSVLAEGIGNPVSGVWQMDLDGSNPLLTFEGAFHPTWSPDGSRLAFQMDEPSGKFIVLWMGEADGNDLHQLTEP